MVGRGSGQPGNRAAIQLRNAIADAETKIETQSNRHPGCNSIPDACSEDDCPRKGHGFTCGITGDRGLRYAETKGPGTVVADSLAVPIGNTHA